MANTESSELPALSGVDLLKNQTLVRIVSF